MAARKDSENKEFLTEQFKIIHARFAQLETFHQTGLGQIKEQIKEVKEVKEEIRGTKEFLQSIDQRINNVETVLKEHITLTQTTFDEVANTLESHEQKLEDIQQTQDSYKTLEGQLELLRVQARTQSLRLRGVPLSVDQDQLDQILTTEFLLFLNITDEEEELVESAHRFPSRKPFVGDV